MSLLKILSLKWAIAFFIVIFDLPNSSLSTFIEKDDDQPWIWPTDDTDKSMNPIEICTGPDCPDLSVEDEKKLRDQLFKQLIKTRGSFINDPCSYDITKPEFKKPGRRIAEEKCLEYSWEKENAGLKKTKESCEKLKQGVKFIIGGNTALPREYPHMGAVGWRKRNGGLVFRCGCTLISPKFALTAAHCSKIPNDPDLVKPVPDVVRLGSLITNDTENTGLLKEIFDEKSDKYLDAKVLKVIVHPKYAPPKKYFDIALLEFVDNCHFAPNIQPACLWTNNTINLGNSVTVTGWGVIDTATHEVSTTLQTARVQIIHSDLCDTLLQSACNRHWCGIKEHQVCAGKLTGGVDACQGDSGGPLQAKIPKLDIEEPLHYVIGITSFGIGCGQQNRPGVYTRVSSFVDWIEDNVWAE